MFGSCMYFCHNRIGQSQLEVGPQKLECLRKVPPAQNLIHPADVKFQIVRKLCLYTSSIGKTLELAK